MTLLRSPAGQAPSMFEPRRLRRADSTEPVVPRPLITTSTSAGASVAETIVGAGASPRHKSRRLDRQLARALPQDALRPTGRHSGRPAESGGKQVWRLLPSGATLDAGCRPGPGGIASAEPPLDTRVCPVGRIASLVRAPAGTRQRPPLPPWRSTIAENTGRLSDVSACRLFQCQSSSRRSTGCERRSAHLPIVASPADLRGCRSQGGRD
mgnify:CR=1 FL=1